MARFDRDALGIAKLAGARSEIGAVGYTRKKKLMRYVRFGPDGAVHRLMASTDIGTLSDKHPVDQLLTIRGHAMMMGDATL